MSEIQIYKRYMVFAWLEYDNTEPFNCCEDSFDNLEEAQTLFESLKDFGKCIFDRVEGKMVTMYYRDEE